jgi:hypothetical protein
MAAAGTGTTEAPAATVKLLTVGNSGESSMPSGADAPRQTREGSVAAELAPWIGGEDVAGGGVCAGWPGELWFAGCYAASSQVSESLA